MLRQCSFFEARPGLSGEHYNPLVAVLPVAPQGGTYFDSGCNSRLCGLRAPWVLSGSSGSSTIFSKASTTLKPRPRPSCPLALPRLPCNPRYFPLYRAYQGFVVAPREVLDGVNGFTRWNLRSQHFSSAL